MTTSTNDQAEDNEVTDTTVKPKIAKPKKDWFDVSRHLTNYFEWHGKICAQHPVKVLLAVLTLLVICMLGLINFHWESNAIKLWIPSSSDFARHYDYLWSKYPPDFRFHSIIFEAPEDDPNILQPKYLQEMYKIHQQMYDITLPNNKTWNDFCFRVPIVEIDYSYFLGKKRRKRQDFFEEYDDSFIDDDIKESDPSVDFYPTPYCNFVESFRKACFEASLLELWAVNGHYGEATTSAIENLTGDQILEKINNVNISGRFLIEKDFVSLLGGVQRDNQGRIISAKAAEFKIIGYMNGTAAKLEQINVDSALGEYVEQSTLEMESHLISLFLSANDANHVKAFVNIARSFNDIASETILSDTSMVVLGFSIVFTYVIFMLGKFSLVESRALLSMAGLTSVAMTIFASYGLCCSLGFAFSPLHNFIPFLLLGLGIDDMFVIMQSLQNLENPQSSDVVSVISQALGRSGVAITVTSLTDVLAFGVGASTVLPALQSFCFFCGMGILIVYILQSTWFVALLSLDQRRIVARRNGFLPCYKHSHASTSTEANDVVTSNEEGKGDILPAAFYHFGQSLLKTPAQVFVAAFTLGLLALSVWGNVELRQEFNPMWFLPRDSYLAQWSQKNELYFPSQGERVHIFVLDLQMPEELEKLDYVIRELNQQNDIISGVEAWFSSFKEYFDAHFAGAKENSGTSLFELSRSEFKRRLTQYLFSPSGSKHRMMFKYDGPISCGEPAPEILMFTMEFTHRLFSQGPRQQIPAMNRVKDILKSANFSGTVFPFSKGYAAWETDEIIAGELYRNLGLAIACISVTTLILLSSLLGCLQVVGCVLLTLVNVAGFMHFWGLTIETVSSTNLIISIGLCVDCPAHITHEFLAAQGTRRERAVKALRNMGPAVLNGGFSTFLSFILLANSDSHVFETFFKIFFLVVAFALYNGLVVLPIILSHFGPAASAAAHGNNEDHFLNGLKEAGQEKELEMEMLPQTSKRD